jgi:hypothetical protein
MVRAIGFTPRERRWLSIMGWLVGVALFVRFTQVLPCCAAPTLDVALRGHVCDAALTTACPRYEDCGLR